MSATTHSRPRSAARRTSLLAFTIASGLVGRDVCLLELVAVGGERDTGFELRGGLGCHVGRDGRAILHAGGEAGDEHGTDQGGAQRGTQVGDGCSAGHPPRRFRGRGRRDGDRPNGDGDDCGARPGGSTPAEAMIRILPQPRADSATVASCRHVCTAWIKGPCDRQRESGRLRSRRRVRGVVADRAQGAGGRGHKVAAGAAADSRLGIDETRFRSVRWILDGITWKRSDPWLTSFVDCSRDGPGSLLGLAPGRTGACVRDWLAEQSEEFRKMIKIVVIDPSAPYASGIRAALPDAKIAVDRWHLVALANQMVTEVRQRVTRDLLGRRVEKDTERALIRHPGPQRRQRCRRRQLIQTRQGWARRLCLGNSRPLYPAPRPPRSRAWAARSRCGHCEQRVCGE